MEERQQQQRPIAIIGAGISGLSAAYRLAVDHGATDVTLLEANETVGGVLQTRQIDGYLVERSADSFLVTDQLPFVRDLAMNLGLAEQLIEPNPAHRRAMIVQGDRLIPVPRGFQLMAATQIGPLLRCPALPWTARIRAALEPWIPRRKSATDESVTDFISRRIGRTAFERLAQPLVAGIYSADPDQLSATAALREYVQLEEKHGSVSRGLRKTGAAQAATSGARYAKFQSLQRGLQSLVAGLEARIKTQGVQIHTGVSVRRITRQRDGWLVDTDSRASQPQQATPRTFARLILATSAASAGELLAPTHQQLAVALQGIPYTKVAVVSVGVRRTDLSRPLDAFGFVVPRRENRSLIAASFSSVKFAGRAAEGDELIRVFVGGALQPELVDLDDRGLEQLATSELQDLLGVRQPRLLDICRWTDASPQYNLGHHDRVARIRAETAAVGNLALAGSAFEGVGIPQCVRSGFAAADDCFHRETGHGT